jgi:hypothetical protein
MIGTIILVSAILLIIAGCFLINNDDLSNLGFGGVIIGSLVLLVIGISIPIHRCAARDLVVYRGSIQNTLNNFRVNGLEIERATVFSDVVQFNRYLAAAHSALKAHLLTCHGLLGRDATITQKLLALWTKANKIAWEQCYTTHQLELKAIAEAEAEYYASLHEPD